MYRVHMPRCHREKPCGSGIVGLHLSQAWIAPDFARNGFKLTRIDGAPVKLKPVRARRNPDFRGVLFHELNRMRILFFCTVSPCTPPSSAAAVKVSLLNRQ